MSPPDKLTARLKYHLIVAPFLPVPKFVGNGANYMVFMVFEFVEGISLLGKTMKDPSQALPYYEHAFELLFEFWQKSKGENTGLRNCSEFQGAEQAIENIMQGKEDLSTVINGKCSNLSLHQVFHSLLDWLKKCQTLCLTHGDTRTDNIIVNPNGEDGIAFIDMRPSFCWLDDLVLLGWQENFRFVNFIEEPYIKSTGKILEINFQTQTSLLQRQVKDLSIAILQRMSKELKFQGPKKLWRSYHYTLAVSAICELAGFFMLVIYLKTFAKIRYQYSPCLLSD